MGDCARGYEAVLHYHDIVLGEIVLGDMSKGVATDLKVGGPFFASAASKCFFLGPPPTFCKDPPHFLGVITKFGGVLKSFSTQ